MTQAEQDEFLEHMRNGMRRGAAAYAMGKTRLEVFDFIVAEGNEEFERAVIDAEGEANEHVEEAIYQAAVSGSVAAARLWLNLRKKPETTMELAVIDEEDGELADIIRMTAE